MKKFKALILIVSILTIGLMQDAIAQSCPLNLRHIKMKTPCNMKVVSAQNGVYEAMDDDVTLIIKYMGPNTLKNIKTEYAQVAADRKLPLPKYGKDESEVIESQYNDVKMEWYTAVSDELNVYYGSASVVRDNNDNTYAVIIICKAEKFNLGNNMKNSLKYVD